MRKNFTLYPPVNEAVSVRSYIHETGKAAEFQEKGVKLLQSFLASVNQPGQKLIGLFRDFKKAMGEPQHLGTQKTGNADVTSTLRNILREIYGPKRFDTIDARMTEVEQHLVALEKLVNHIANEDVSQSLSELGKSKRQLARERPEGVVKATNPQLEKPKNPVADAEHEDWKRSLPTEGSPEWDVWVAKRADHIRKEKEQAHLRGDADKGDHLHSHDWNDTAAHHKQAHDEIKRYVNSGKDNKQFVWNKHFKDWRGYIGHAIHEYNELKFKQEDAFFKSIMPPKPKAGYM